MRLPRPPHQLGGVANTGPERATGPTTRTTQERPARMFGEKMRPVHSRVREVSRL